MYSKEIETFIVTVEEGSFTKSANKLFVTPATVMNQINALENRIQVTLLNRTNRGIELTDAGSTFYIDCKRMVDESKLAIQRAQQIDNRQQRPIRLGTSLLHPGNILLDLINHTETPLSDFRIEIVPFEYNNDNVLSFVSNLGKTFDIMVGASNSMRWEQLINVLPIGYYPLCVSVSRSHSFAKETSLNIEDLYGERLMMIKEGDSKLIDSLRHHIIQEHPQIEILDTTQFYDVETFNIAEKSENLLLTLDIWRNVHPSLVTIPVNWDFKVANGLMYSKNPSPHVKDFIKILEKTIKQ